MDGRRAHRRSRRGVAHGSNQLFYVGGINAGRGLNTRLTHLRLIARRPDRVSHFASI